MNPLRRKSKSESFLDGCHRYGWLINLLVTFATTLIMLARFSGMLEATQQQFDKRLTHVEQTITEILLKR
jgi:hypothetical protein